MSIIHSSASLMQGVVRCVPSHPDLCPRRFRRPRRRPGALRRHPPRLHAGRRRAPVRLLPHPPHARRDGRRAAVAPAEDRAVRADARRADRQSGGAAGQGRAARRSTCPAGRSRPTPTPPARCIRTSRCIRWIRCRTWCAASTTRCAAPTRSATPRAADGTYWMAPIVADAEAGFGGALNALRADEGDDRGRRRGRAFRGPARVARRSAAISAARCWCRSASTSAR